MFGLFKKDKSDNLPVSIEERDRIEAAFAWMVGQYGEESLKNRKVLTPYVTDFPIKYNGSEASARATLNIVAKQMEINPDDLHLDIYSEGVREIQNSPLSGGRMFIKQIDGEKYSAGKYWGKQDDGKYHIGLEDGKLKQPEAMVATLAHELAHVKLLGENRIQTNDESLTDFTTVVFGLGIFNANEAFWTKASFDSWGWSKLGYLSQMQWGYSLAAFSAIRKEESPEWLKFLNVNIKKDFQRSMTHIFSREEEFFSKLRSPNNTDLERKDN